MFCATVNQQNQLQSPFSSSPLLILMARGIQSEAVFPTGDHGTELFTVLVPVSSPPRKGIGPGA